MIYNYSRLPRTQTHAVISGCQVVKMFIFISDSSLFRHLCKVSCRSSVYPARRRHYLHYLHLHYLH